MIKKENFVLFITLLLLACALGYCVIMSSLRYIAAIIFGVSVVFAAIYLLLEKLCGGLSMKTKGAVILTQTLILGLFVYHLVHFCTFPFIVTSSNKEKVEEVQTFIAKNYRVDSIVHLISKDKVSLELLTYSHRVYDKIALSLVQDNIYSDDLKVGIYYKPSDDKTIGIKRAEEAINNRFKMIKGVKSVDTKIKPREINGEIDPEMTKYEVNIVFTDLADKDYLLTTVFRSLPVSSENITVKTHKE